MDVVNKLDNMLDKSSSLKDESEKYDFLKFLFDEKDIETKSEISNVVVSCALRTLVDYAISHNLMKTANTLLNFDRNYLKRMLSHNRMSREEAFKSLMEFKFFEKESDSNEIKLNTIRKLRGA